METKCPACQGSLKATIEGDESGAYFRYKIKLEKMPCKDYRRSAGVMYSGIDVAGNQEQLNSIFQKHARKYSSATQWRKHIMKDLMDWKQGAQLHHIHEEPKPVVGYCDVTLFKDIDAAKDTIMKYPKPDVIPLEEKGHCGEAGCDICEPELSSNPLPPIEKLNIGEKESCLIVATLNLVIDRQNGKG